MVPLFCHNILSTYLLGSGVESARPDAANRTVWNCHFMLPDSAEQFSDDISAYESRIWHPIFHITQVPFSNQKMG